MSEALFETPNLDDLSIDHEDYREAERVFDLLSQYSRLKRGAMVSRLAGNIVQANNLETQCDVTYGELPEWAQW